MTITQIELYLVQLPLREPWHTAYGSETVVETVLLRAQAAADSVWVETCPHRYPTYAAACATSTFHVIADLFGPRILGQELVDEHTIGKLLQPFRGNRFAKAGLDLCWWALEAQRRDVPLWILCGGTPDSVKIRVPIGLSGSVPELLQRIDGVVQQGIDAIKLKIGPDFEPEWIREVRASFPNVNITVDCNGSFRATDSSLLRTLDRHGVGMIEQPFADHDLAGHAALQKKIRGSVCLDESIRSPADAEAAIRAGACKAISIKVGRVGGLTAALEIVQLCAESGVACHVGSMLESGIGTAINLALARRMPAAVVHGITLPAALYNIDLLGTPQVVAAPGRVTCGTDTYIGVSVQEETVTKLARKAETLRL